MNSKIVLPIEVLIWDSVDSFGIQKWFWSLCWPPEIESQVWFVVYGKSSHAHCSVMPDSFVTPWTIALSAALSMAFSRQEYWSGLPFPSSWDLHDPGIEPSFSALAGRFFTTLTPRKILSFFASSWNCPSAIFSSLIRFSVTHVTSNSMSTHILHSLLLFCSFTWKSILLFTC